MSNESGWDKARMVTYVAGALAALAALAAALGWVSFDMASGTVTPEPFNIYAAANAVVMGASSVVAAWAWLTGKVGMKK